MFERTLREDAEIEIEQLKQLRLLVGTPDELAALMPGVVAQLAQQPDLKGQRRVGHLPPVHHKLLRLSTGATISNIR